MPAGSMSLNEFRQWTYSDAFPKTGLIAFIGKEIFIDMSPERLRSHGSVKTEVCTVVNTLVRKKKSGKFYFDKRQAVLQPQQDVKIIPSSDFSSWKIVTPDGSTYTFGGSTATEVNYFSGGAGGGCCSPEQISSTTWYLTKVENFNKNRFIIIQ